MTIGRMRFTVRNVGSTVPRVASKLASCGRAIGRHCFHIHGDSGEEVIAVTIDSVATTVPPDSGVPPTLAPNVESQTAEDDVSIGSGPFDLESTVAGLADRAGTPRR